MPHLNSAWADEKGLVVISVTDEPIELVAPWIEANKVTHPVVILPDGALENVIGVEYFPTGAVFSGTELVWKGGAGGTGPPLAKVYKDARKDSIYPKKLGKVIKSMNASDHVKALAELSKLKPKLEGNDASWAVRLETYMLETCAKAFESSAKAIKDGFWLKGIGLAQPYLAKGSLFPGVKEKAAALASLKENDLYGKELAGGKLYLKGQEFEKAKAYTDAVKAYKSAMKKGGSDSQINGHARTAARTLIKAGKPGFKSTCPSCKRNKGAACDKHHEKIKL